MPSRPMHETSYHEHSTAVRSVDLGEGARAERLARLKNLWRVVRAHVIGEVPITNLDLGPRALDLQAPPRERRPARDASVTDRDTTVDLDTAVDEASAASFPASDAPAFTASRV